MVKQCSTCKEFLDETRFASKGGGKLHSQCKNCKKVAIKAHYERNKQAYIDRAKAKNKETKEIIENIVKDRKAVPCADCGKLYQHYVMDFDHIDASKKVMAVSELKRHYSVDKLLKEIDKCEVVCSNCHRERTWERGQYGRGTQVRGKGP